MAGAITASAIPAAMGIGAAVGAAAGTLGETLVRHGFDEEEAGRYGDHLGRGEIPVSVDATEGMTADMASDILYRNGGHSARRSKVSTY